MIHFHRFKIATLLMTAYALHSGAGAQHSIQNSAQPAVSPVATACPPVKQLKAVQIHGMWRVRFNPAPAGLPADATMHIERHAQFSDSVAGYINRDLGLSSGAGHAARAQLAGDLEDGFLTLDESSNGISITATWNGEMVEASCGKKVTGTWKDTSASAPADAPDIPFMMEKIPGW